MTNLWQSLSNYYLLDWVGMLTSFWSVYLLGNKNPHGFIVFMFSNVCWAGVGLMTDSSALYLGNLIFFFLNLQGLLKWRK